MDLDIPDGGKQFVCPTCTSRFQVLPDGSTRRPPGSAAKSPPRILNERHVAFVRQLEAELPGWERAGIVTPQQGERILERYADLGARKRGGLLSRSALVLGILGVLLVVIGCGIAAVADWGDIAREGKIALLIVSMALFQLSGCILHGAKRPFPRLGTALIFLGSLLYALSLVFVVRLYQLPLEYPSMLFFWGAGTLPLAYAAGSPLLLLLTVGSFLAWIVSEGQLYVIGGQPLSLIPLVGSYGVSFWLMGSLHKASGRHELASPWIFAGLAAILGAFLSYTFPQTWRTVMDPQGLGMLYALSSFAVVTALGCLALKRTPGSWIPLAVGSCLMLFFLGSGFGWLHFSAGGALAGSALCTLLYAVFLLGVIYHGFQQRDMLQVNTALLFFILYLSGHYTSLFWNSIPRPLFFLAGGGLLIAGGLFLERKRRILHANLLDEGVAGEA